MTAPRIPRQGPGLQGPRDRAGLPYPHPTRKNGASARLGRLLGRYTWELWVLAAFAVELAVGYWAGGGFR